VTETTSTIDITAAFPAHDGRCDLEEAGCRNPIRFVKLAACAPELWLPSAPAASVAFYCSREHAAQEPTATLADAERVAEIVDGNVAHDVEGNAIQDVWRALLDAYPEPVEAAD
jgi:hypothetical protein